MKDKLRLLAEQTGNPALGTFSLDDLTEDNVKKESDNVLVYSQHDNNKIYILDGEQPVEIAERDSEVSALVSHEGEMYDGGVDGKIFETLTGEKIAERDGWVLDLVSHNGTLYDANGVKIYETLTGEVIAERDYQVFSLCAHNGALYDAGGYEIYETLTGEVIAERDNLVKSLISHDSVLHDAGSYGIYETFSGKRITGDSIFTMASVPRYLLEDKLQ